jgi:3-isopropylmalate dehydrogenase
MSKYKISLIPGDGIGPELSEATLEILNAIQQKFDIELEVIKVEAGDACYEKTGVALPEETVEVIRKSHACMKGPV